MANIITTPAGEMNRRITILSPQAGPADEMGVNSTIQVARATVWAKVSPISGSEKILNAVDASTITHEVRMRFVNFIDASCTLALQSANGRRLLDIVDVYDVEEQRTELAISCVEQKGNNGK